jgi:hypothetical protein
MSKESFEMKDYLSQLNLSSALLKLQIRSKMLDIKFNCSAKYEKESWLCDSCCSSIETQSHLLLCLAYATLRDGKNLSNDDLLPYIQIVTQIRTELNLRKGKVWWPHGGVVLACSQLVEMDMAQKRIA